MSWSFRLTNGSGGNKGEKFVGNFRDEILALKTITTSSYDSLYDAMTDDDSLYIVKITDTLYKAYISPTSRPPSILSGGKYDCVIISFNEVNTTIRTFGR